jgi:hypothetical protein
MVKRKFPRLDENWKINFRVIEGRADQASPIGSLALNVSGGGICFTSRMEVLPGSMLAIELESTDFEMPILAMAQAIWCKRLRTPDLYDVGCEFWWLGWKDTNTQQALANYIKTKIEPPNKDPNKD